MIFGDNDENGQAAAFALADELHAVDYPEDFLWVPHPEGTLRVITRERLYHLATGEVTPRDEAEKLLVADPKWLDVYLRHIIGEYCITITVGKQLPKWEPWVEALDG